MNDHPNSDREPHGDLVLRTAAMPANTNANGDIFGGSIMSQMDIGGAILAKEIAQGRVVTVAVDGMTFHHPVSVGHVVCCYGKCVRLGTTSITIKLEVWVKPVCTTPKVNATASRKLCSHTSPSTKTDARERWRQRPANELERQKADSGKTNSFVATKW